ncbi:MAG TPA: T9SS type A sorting domain-containing protein [Bacteroidales bacterium]
MKKLIFTLIAVFTLTFTFAQVPRENVLLEIGTGGWCVYCPGAAMGADDLHANGDPVAIIEYHNGDPYATTESNARNSYYSISGYPTAWFDGSYNTVVGGSATQSMYGTYLPIVTARMAIPTAFTLEIMGDATGDTYNIVVRVNKVGTYTGTNLKVRFAVTESDIQYNWQNQSEMNFVCRDMVPTEAGTAVSFASGDQQEINLSFQYNNTWVEEEVELIAFIQDDANKQVLHCAKVMITDLEPAAPTFAAGFFADPTDMCDPGYAQFYSDCIGTPISWKWTFEGGYPAVSYEKNPEVFYQAVGSYDVRLIVSDGTHIDTAFSSKYISVHGAPEVTFTDVPELCDEDWDPYELTEGVPGGGTYSGPYVTEGMYFHPTEAGVGEYVLTYTYTDEYGCVNSDQQTVIVTSCTGIGDNKDNVGLQVYPNPTQGLMTVTIDASMDQAQIRIIDMVGKIVYEQANININGSYKASVDLSTLPQGIYFVTVSGGDKSISKKVFLTK